MKTLKNNLSVFLVDDDKMFVMSLKHELTRRFKNIKLYTFLSGEECLDHLADKPDIIILDYYLANEIPDSMNGIEVLKKIKSIYKDIEVIILSAQDKIEVALNAIKNGAYEYVPKTETALFRVQNILRNILFNIEYLKENKRYEKWNYIMAVFLIIFVAFIAVYFFAG